MPTAEIRSETIRYWLKYGDKVRVAIGGTGKWEDAGIATIPAVPAVCQVWYTDHEDQVHRCFRHPSRKRWYYDEVV